MKGNGAVRSERVYSSHFNLTEIITDDWLVITFIQVPSKESKTVIILWKVVGEV